jgi:hypothetical protein
MAEIYHGWVDEIDDGLIWGRIVRDGKEVEFHAPFLLINESARVEMRPGSYVTLRNCELAHDCTMWTTHDIERGNAEADLLWEALFGSALPPAEQATPKGTEAG